MPFSTPLQIIVLSLTFGLSAVTHAQLYKTVDENGKVTYSDTPPTKTVGGKEDKNTKKIVIDLKANRADALSDRERVMLRVLSDSDQQRKQARSEQEAVEAARQQLSDAKRRQSNEQEPQESDYVKTGMSKGVPTRVLDNDRFAARVKALQVDVDIAGDALEAALKVVQQSNATSTIPAPVSR